MLEKTTKGGSIMGTNCPKYPDSKDKHSFCSGKRYEKHIKGILIKEVKISLDIFESPQDQIHKGESEQGFEIKLDRRISDTKNLSIEIAEKSRADNWNYIPSGIFREDNTWFYVQGNYDIVLIFSKKRLQQLSHDYPVDTFPTIQRFLIPLETAKQEAIKIIPLTDKGKELLSNAKG